MRAKIVGALLLLMLAFGVLLLAWPLILRTAIVGMSGLRPDEFAAGASPEARALVARALEGLENGEIVDIHAHIAGSQDDGSGCHVSADMFSWLHPWRRIQYSAYLEACGVEDVAHGNDQMVARLLSVTRGKAVILALDHHYGQDGTIDRESTPLYVPNDLVLRLAEAHPDRFLPGVSVNPYRKDALAELDRCAARGAKIVKWLPNSMLIDPAAPACDAFYDRMRERGMSLLTHAGEEKALAQGAEELGNPLRLRRALDRGLRVIVAHCASMGEAEDLDDPSHGRVQTFELFLRMMGEERYRGLLFGDLSAVEFMNRDPEVMRTLLERTDLHERLLDGTDWPLPAMKVMISTGKYVKVGLITAEEKEALDEVFRYDPRLFDLALKRTIRGRHGERFPASIFMRRGEILP